MESFGIIISPQSDISIVNVYTGCKVELKQLSAGVYRSRTVVKQARSQGGNVIE